MDNKETDNNQSPGPLDVMKSVLAAMFGVQTEENRQRDFSKGKASHFIIGGIIFTIVFILTLVQIVSSVT